MNCEQLVNLRLKLKSDIEDSRYEFLIHKYVRKKSEKKIVAEVFY